MNLKNSQDINSFDEENSTNNINNYEISNISSSQNDFKFSNNNITKDNITHNFESITNTINTDKNNINNNKEDINNELINSNKNFNTNHNNDNNNNNNNDNSNNNSKIISNLLYQLKKMSDKQLYLLDIISNLQKNSSEQINSLNRRIEELEEKVINQRNKDQNYENTDERFNMNESDSDNPNFILKKLLGGNNYEQLIKYLKELSLEQIKKLEIKLIEDTLIKLCILLTEGFKVHDIISFIKGILIINKIKLKEITKKNLKDILNYVQQNLKNLKDEDSIDISLIISYLNI